MPSGRWSILGLAPDFPTGRNANHLDSDRRKGFGSRGIRQPTDRPLVPHSPCETPGRATCPGEVGSPTPTSLDCIHPFKRRLRLCDPEVATANSSWELAVGSSSKEKLIVTRAVATATRFLTRASLADGSSATAAQSCTVGGRLQPIVSTRQSRVRVGPQSLRQRLGYVQHEETLCRISVVFAALVDHTKVPMSCGFLVSYHRIQLPGFERGRIPRVVNADSEFCSSPWFASHASIQQRELQFEFLPSDPVRLVPMDLCCVNRTMPEAYFGNAP